MARIILLASSSLENKGDALMVLAARQALGDEHSYALPANVAIKGRTSMRSYFICLWCDRPPTTFKRRLFTLTVAIFNAVFTLLPRKLLQRFRIVLPSDIDLVIDVSGYCYGDPWGQELIDYMMHSYSQYKSRNVPIVLLPKTWGPFRTISSDSVARLIETADLVFARDHCSFSELIALCPPSQKRKIHWAPDYTHQVRHSPAATRETSKNAHDFRKLVYIIPSLRVVDNGTFSLTEYCQLLGLARRIVTELGGSASLLIHETASDLLIVPKLVKFGFHRPHVVIEDDPTKIKALIADSYGVVTSRLHGLYNALNSGVPPVVIPWNFKYLEALKAYSCEDQLVDTANAAKSLDELLRRIFDEAFRSHLKANLFAATESIEVATMDMWRLVRSCSFRLSE